MNTVIWPDRKSTRLNSSHPSISYAVFCLKKKKIEAPIRIMVANAKGCCGKTTIATNLASFMSNSGHKTAIIDYDPQCSSIDWLKDRDEHLPVIHGVPAAQRTNPTGSTRSWSLRVPSGTTRVILDTLFFLTIRQPPSFTLFPYTTLFR